MGYKITSYSTCLAILQSDIYGVIQTSSFLAASIILAALCLSACSRFTLA